jgi:folate-dependent phosphoribosylglycinamide formyltransferase PurN
MFTKAVVANKEKETGITIHYVNENLMKEELYFKKSNLEVKRQKTLLKGS